MVDSIYTLNFEFVERTKLVSQPFNVDKIISQMSYHPLDVLFTFTLCTRVSFRVTLTGEINLKIFILSFCANLGPSRSRPSRRPESKT